jgi:hypothetical protein
VGQLSLWRATAVLQCGGGVALGKMSSREKRVRARRPCARESSVVPVGSGQSSRGAITFDPGEHTPHWRMHYPVSFFQHDRRAGSAARITSRSRAPSRQIPPSPRAPSGLGQASRPTMAQMPRRTFSCSQQGKGSFRYATCMELQRVGSTRRSYRGQSVAGEISYA